MKLRFLDVIPGTLFTTAGWVVTSVLFAIYVDHFGNYATMYGSLGGVIVLLLWFYFSSQIILIGGEINALLLERRKKSAIAEPRIFVK